MSAKRGGTFLMAAGAAALAFGLVSPAIAGPIGLIDSFDDTNLSEYTLTKVLDASGTADNLSFSSPSGVLTVTSTGSDGPEQVLFFRNDGASLGVGEELRASAAITNLDTGGQPADFGIAVGATPTAGVRQDFLFVSFRGTTQLNSRGFDGTSELGQVQAFGVTPETLFIARTAADTFEVGYYDDGVRTVMVTRTVSNAAVGDNIGFYADLRADGAIIDGLDDLTIAAIPEPASLGLLGLASLVGLRRRRTA